VGSRLHVAVQEARPGRVGAIPKCPNRALGVWPGRLPDRGLTGRDVLETHAQNGSHVIRVQIMVQIEGETFSTETRGFQMLIVWYLLTAARDRPISPSD